MWLFNFLNLLLKCHIFFTINKKYNMGKIYYWHFSGRNCANIYYPYCKKSDFLNVPPFAGKTQCMNTLPSRVCSVGPWTLHAQHHNTEAWGSEHQKAKKRSMTEKRCHMPSVSKKPLKHDESSCCDPAPLWTEALSNANIIPGARQARLPSSIKHCSGHLQAVTGCPLPRPIGGGFAFKPCLWAGGGGAVYSDTVKSINLVIWPSVPAFFIWLKESA